MLPERNDTINCIVIFKDNRMSVYSGVDKATGWKEIRIGEISKMTDEEIIDKCEQTLYKYASNVEYDLHVYTDGTGNFTDYEKIEFDDITEVNPNTNYLPLHLSNICIYNSDINIPAVVYDSTFYKLPDDEKAGKKGYWYRSDGYTLNLDTPYSEGVLVDPCYNENSQDNDNLLDLYNALRELENDKESKSDKDEIS